MREGTALLNHAQGNLVMIDTRFMACGSQFRIRAADASWN